MQCGLLIITALS